MKFHVKIAIKYIRTTEDTSVTSRRKYLQSVFEFAEIVDSNVSGGGAAAASAFSCTRPQKINFFIRLIKLDFLRCLSEESEVDVRRD